MCNHGYYAHDFIGTMEHCRITLMVNTHAWALEDQELKALFLVSTLLHTMYVTNSIVATEQHKL